MDGIFELVQLGFNLGTVVIEHSILLVFLDCRLKVTEGIFILPKFHVALTAVVPVFSYFFLRSILICSVQLNGHCEIRDSACEIALGLVYSSLKVICLGQIYKTIVTNVLLGFFAIAFSKCVRAMSKFYPC